MATVQDLRPVDDGIGGHLAGILANGAVVDVMLTEKGDGFDVAVLVGEEITTFEEPLVDAAQVNAVIQRAEKGFL